MFGVYRLSITHRSTLLHVLLRNDYAMLMTSHIRQYDVIKFKKKSQKKTTLQQCVLLRITLTKIIPLQNGTKESKIIFPATQND